MTRHWLNRHWKLLDMRYFWFVGRYFVWVGVSFPWLHIEKRHAH